MNFATLENMGEKYCIIVHITKKGDQELPVYFKE